MHLHVIAKIYVNVLKFTKNLAAVVYIVYTLVCPFLAFFRTIAIYL